jgi:hypothetical protein
MEGKHKTYVCKVMLYPTEKSDAVMLHYRMEYGDLHSVSMLFNHVLGWWNLSPSVTQALILTCLRQHSY